MRSFKDTTGRDWTIAVNVDSIKRVRDLCKVNLLSIVDDKMKLLNDLGSDFILLADVLYSLCKPEADGRNVSDVNFGQSLSGDALWDGFNAMLDELVAFFPDPRRRNIMGTLVEKIRTATGMILDEAEKQVNAIDISEPLKDLKISSGNSPESSESIPDL